LPHGARWRLLLLHYDATWLSHAPGDSYYRVALSLPLLLMILRHINIRRTGWAPHAAASAAIIA